ncbi:MAG: hypothetical protein J6D46_06105 [Lachnospiraceae bacterium]|nr:hypothetical protein [Lachnospiraceae bacterium]
MDEFSAGIQEPGGKAGEKSGGRSEIEIFDFVNQKPDLTTLDKGLFAEDNQRSLPKTSQVSAEPGPRYENAWEEIELRDTERKAQERRRAASGRRSVSGRAGNRGAEAGTRHINGKRTAEAVTGHVSGKRAATAGTGHMSVKRTAEAGTGHVTGKHTAEAGKRSADGRQGAEAGRKRVSGKRRALRAAKMKQERIARIRIALIAAVVLLCVLAGIFFAQRKSVNKAIPVTVRKESAALVSVTVPKESAAFVSVSVPGSIGLSCGDNSSACIFFNL